MASRCVFPERRNDHEIELVVVIGREGTRHRRRAPDYVAGYTLGLDAHCADRKTAASAIDRYLRGARALLVTADEI